MPDGVATRLAHNLKHLRQARGLTQQQIARLAGIPRATWGHMESGAGNPTLNVLHRVALALQVPIEELTAAPRELGRLYRASDLAARHKGEALVRSLLPDPLPGVVLERLEMPPGSRFAGVPHMTGAREYLACEIGAVALAVGGEHYRLGPGDVLVFKGDERHSYRNPGAQTAIAYSIVLLAPVR